MLMAKYNVPADRVIRHCDVNGKPCPAYWCGTAEKDAKWKSEFWNKLKVAPAKDANREKVKARFGLSDATLDYLEAYQYGADLLRKLATSK